MINTKQIIVSLSLVLMVFVAPVSAMNLERKKAASKAQKAIEKRKKEIKNDKYAQFEEVVEVIPAEKLPEQPVQVAEVPHSGAIVVYKDSSEIINAATPAFDLSFVSFACKLAQGMQLSSSKAFESLFAKIIKQNQNQALLAQKQNLFPKVNAPEIVKPKESLAQAVEEKGILRDKNGKIIAQVTDADDDNLVDHIVIEKKVIVDNPTQRVVDAENPLVDENLDDRGNPQVYSLSALRKPIIFGLGICGVATLGWKLYQKTSHYQSGLLQRWQMQVADAIAGITSGVKSNKQILPIEVSQLTRLTDVEREQLAQVHNSLVMAFDKAQQTVAQAATDDVAGTPVVKELKSAHAQWDNVMNNCKNAVEQGSMRFW